LNIAYVAGRIDGAAGPIGAHLILTTFDSHSRHRFAAPWKAAEAAEKAEDLLHEGRTGP
jgi:hypothetical protein